MATILNVEKLFVRYGAIEALHGVSLKVEAGQIVCLIGANGAGKSSLLRCISGLVPAAGGTIEYWEKPKAKRRETKDEMKNGGGKTQNSKLKTQNGAGAVMLNRTA